MRYLKISIKRLTNHVCKLAKLCPNLAQKTLLISETSRNVAKLVKKLMNTCKRKNLENPTRLKKTSSAHTIPH
jgi:hypothetical protein